MTIKKKFKQVFGKIKSSLLNSNLKYNEIEHDKYVDFYYTNVINSIILFTYNSSQLEEMTPILIDPLNELYEELEYAFTDVCFETVFRLELLDNSIKNELLEFKKEVDKIPNEIWEWDFIDSEETWKQIRLRANKLLNKMGVSTRTYNIDYTNIYDNEGNIVIKGKKT